ncbi:uncharacterized protein [Battus philenor]|uniref:uncharacterized protein n=1 Tax=Battus philenor TaxID=42288 RepID=UPI0035CEC9F6
MFKLIVLSAILAAIRAEPGVLLAPAPYSDTIPVPVSTSYVQHSSSYFPAPAVYSALPYSHFIKKRSPQLFGGYLAPRVYSGTPLVTPYVAAPYSAAVLPAYAAPAHFIKKRSAALLAPSASYIAPAPIASTYFSSAALPATYSSAILPSPYYPTYPYSAGIPYFKNYVQQSSSFLPAPAVYSALSYSHLVKKFSLQLYGGFLVPDVYSGVLVTPYIFRHL